MTITGTDTLNTRRSMTAGGKEYDYFSLKAAEAHLGDLSRLPFSLKVLLENLLRFEDGKTVSTDDVMAIKVWLENKKNPREIAYRPARVLMQDFTGVPAVVDLAAMRDAMTSLGGDAQKINPKSNVDLVIDHSVMVDEFGSPRAFQANVDREFIRNGERYAFLRWGQQAFNNFRVVPPGTGICHQVNVENLAQTIWSETDETQPGKTVAYPDTVVGTDSHTTMVNGLAVLGWGVGGIEAEAAMLGQPISMLIPEVIGFKLTGAQKEGTTATDIVLTITQMLREHGVVGKFVEFYGPGIATLSLSDRATISNMAPEYGATCGFFPIDEETVRYLEFTGRDKERVALVEAYAKEQGMWRTNDAADPIFTDTLSLDISTVVPTISGPKRPQDKILLKDAAPAFASHISDKYNTNQDGKSVVVDGEDYELSHGDVVIAAITSCTNTSNPNVMVAAGLVAKNALAKGMQVKPWVKTSLAPGSQVVTDYLEKANLQDDLDALGFNLVGYGCTTCIGNSGPLPEHIEKAVVDGDLTVCGVLSGNRNFEGRIHQNVTANYLASPPLVVAYALAGNMNVDLFKDAIGQDADGNDVYLKDIWPSNQEIAEAVSQAVTPEMFEKRYANVFTGTSEWQNVKITAGQTYDWVNDSTYVQNPPYFTGMTMDVAAFSDVSGAKALAVLGDSVTTDHISPAGAIKGDSPAGHYLQENGVDRKDFNSYGSRRGNHEIMMRGTFANVRIKNEMLDDVEGGYTKYLLTGETMAIYDAAMKYQETDTPLVVIAGREYGTGSSRDWAAKGTRLLGVKAVVTESFERIHRSNLVGMGVLPLQFKAGVTRETLGLNGTETYDLTGIAGKIQPGCDIQLKITYADGKTKNIDLLCRIDTLDELEYFKNGGILHYVLRSMAA